jgi:hypothetical protein
MGMPAEPTVRVMVESFKPKSTNGLHGEVHIRPVAGQAYPPTLHVRCSKGLSRNYPVGTKFWIFAKLTDREGGSQFMSSHHSWDYEVVE